MQSCHDFIFLNSVDLRVELSFFELKVPANGIDWLQTSVKGGPLALGLKMGFKNGNLKNVKQVE